MACVPWRSPPPDLYKLRPVLGYRNHDITKKRAPAWSFVRYIPIPKPKPVVSLSPFQKKMMKSKRAMHKRKQDWGFEQDDFASGDSRARKKFNARRRRMNKKNKRRTNQTERTRSNANEKQTEVVMLKDKAKKPTSRMSAESGKFIISPEDMCDLCFPWAKKKDKKKEKADDSVDSKSRKSRRSRSFSLTQAEEQSDNVRHSFIAIPMGRPGGEICEPHSGIMLPSGRRIAVKHILPKLPPPPKEEEVIEKYPAKTKSSNKTSAKA